ncbi:response regulator transcription factor [Lactiplantibacillus sp. WILCCON 0030]|uniref:Response regulator transcription factor n=1 Tax=Lactiplantibacillus brownii TaxID=3069269 RepID=A0ABU1AEF2_9LACO|nr:response regulator transcription factor [Lactiplantibacillus brownii]MDQ7938692.1 response regulator transcription factor [Lactiplantibacillus brownii]
MHSVMIVDDEYMILKGMAKIVNWQEHGLEIVQTARNGKQALAAFKQQPVDLVITDVRMPEMSGLALMQRLQGAPQPPIVIVLSGYQEFDYVKQALHFGAMDYLVKPIDAQELDKVLDKAHEQLEQRTKTDATKHYYLEMQTERLVAQELTTTQIKQLLTSAGVDPDRRQFTVISCNIVTNYEALSQACQRQKQYLYYSSQDQFIICFVGSHRDLTKFIQQLELQQLIAGESFVTVGQQVSQLSELADSLEQAQTLAELYQFYEDRSPFLSGESRTEWLRQAEIPKISLDKFKRALGNDNQELMVTLTRAMFARLSNEHVAPSYTRQVAFLVLNVLSNSQAFSNQEYERQLTAIDEAPTIAVLEEAVVAIVQHFEPKQQPTFSKNVRQVITIVNQEYVEDLSLTQVANRLHLNPVYLGQLFKKEVHTSFSKYLNQYRITQAKEMLAHTDESISNIALEIGYTNSGYFYKNFRLICDISPKEYRRQALGQPMG